VDRAEARGNADQAGASAGPYAAQFRAMERREWWTWGWSILVMLLLTGGIASLAFPAIHQDELGPYRWGVFQAVAGLVFLILLLGGYLTYEKVLINRLRLELVERQSHFATWRNLALADPLTGLYNRRYAERRLKEEIARSQRKGYDLTIVLLDLDNFKPINDRFGHAAGDAVLKEFAARLLGAIRQGDFAARLGGDEFMLLLTECNRFQAEAVLKRLEGVEVSVEGQRIGVDFSAGCEQYEPGDSVEELLREADKALYSNKQGRKPTPQAT
jgi:diguanylate cyclase (GGDEF)-like protein